MRETDNEELMALTKQKEVKNQHIKYTPFKRGRDINKMPFRKGMGLSVAGWQFVVVERRNSGHIVLKPVGKLISVVDAEKSVAEKEDKAGNTY